LGFRERIGPFHLDWILRGEDKERGAKLMAVAGDCDGPLLHCLEERRLGLGRGPIDFVGQDDIGENGTTLEAETAGPAPLRFDHDIRADQVGGHQVRGELNP